MSVTITNCTSEIFTVTNLRFKFECKHVRNHVFVRVFTPWTRLQLPPAVGAGHCRAQEQLGSDSHSRESARQNMMWQPSVAEHSPPLLTES